MVHYSSRWGTTAQRRVLRVADGGSPSWGDSEGLCWIIQNNTPRTNSTQQLLLWGSLRRLTPQTAKCAALRSYRGTVVVQRRADLSASSGCWFEIMPCWGSLGSYSNPRVIAWSLPTWSVVWSRALGGFTVPAVSRSRPGRWRDSCRDDGSDWDFQTDRETDGRTDGRARSVMRPITSAALQTMAL